MGFNFQAGTIEEIFGEDPDSNTADRLKSMFGEAVPLGSGEDYYSVEDELGWSWWSELQAFGTQVLGEESTKHLNAVDAWCGVYLDVRTDRQAIWLTPENKQRESVKPKLRAHMPGETFIQRVLRKLGLRKPAGMDAEAMQAILQMTQELGARQGERHAMQIADLRGLMHELEQLLASIGVEANEEAVRAKYDYYADATADRFDDDPHIQCLCHAWLTGRYALDHGCPMWLVK